MRKSILRTLVGCGFMASLVALSACAADEVDGGIDDPAEVAEQQAQEQEPVAEAEQALETWYCEGWIPELYQYCLTKCFFKQALMPVGSEDWVKGGQCQAKAETFCQSHGWGAHYDACWGWHY